MNIQRLVVPGSDKSDRSIVEPKTVEGWNILRHLTVRTVSDVEYKLSIHNHHQANQRKYPRFVWSLLFIEHCNGELYNGKKRSSLHLDSPTTAK